MNLNFRENSGSSSRMLLLDLFRLFAASYVMFYHYCFSSNNSNDNTPLQFPDLSPIFQYGFMGVDFFFVISGFVICMSAERGGIDKFISSRVLRLYPAYIVCVCLSAIFAVLFSVKDISVVQFLVNLTMLQEFLGVSHIDGVYWILSFELVFYFWIGVIIIFKAMDRVEFLILPFLVISFFSAFLAEPKIFKAAFISPWFHYFAAGIFFYRARQYGFSGFRVLSILFCLVISLARASELSVSMSDYHGVQFSFFAMAVHVLIIYFVMFLASLGCFDSVSQQWFRAAGALTFPLYLLHGVIGNVILAHFSESNRVLALFITVTIIMAMSYIVSRYLEPKIIGRIKPFVDRFVLAACGLLPFSI